MIVTIKAFTQLVHGLPIIVQKLNKDVHEQDKMDHNWLTLGYLEKRSMFCCVLFFLIIAMEPVLLDGSASCGSNKWKHPCASLWADNEVLRAEDPHAQRVLCGV